MALRDALRSRWVAMCESFATAAAIRIDRTDDLRTGCVRDRLWSPATRSSNLALVNLIIVVEVLSPTTAAIDHGRKLSGYFSLPSVEHYLILDPERRVVIHHKRGRGDAIETRVLSDGAVKLDPPGFEVAVEALFPAPLKPAQNLNSVSPGAALPNWSVSRSRPRMPEKVPSIGVAWLKVS